MKIKKYKILFKKMISIFLIVLVLRGHFINTYAVSEKNNNSSNNKLYLIKNPDNGVLRVINDSGKTLIKTETGLNKKDYDERKRQENLLVKNFNGYNIIIKETDVNKMGKEIQMYDENGNFISYIDDSYVSFDGEKIVYTFNSKKYEYYINKKTNNLAKNAITIPNDNSIFNNNLLPKRNSLLTDEINTDNISITKNQNGTLLFNSKKYDFKIDDIKYYREYERCVDVKIYEIVTNNFISYVNPDGRLIVEVHKSFDFNPAGYPDKKFYFISDNYIIVSTDGVEKATYLIKYSDYPIIITDVYDRTIENVYLAWDIVVFGEIIKKENNSYNYVVREIDGIKYLLCFGKNNSVYSMDGVLLDNILFDYNYTLIKKNNKCYLYNARNLLIKDDIDTLSLNSVYAERDYSELSNSIIVKNNNKSHIINQDGSVFISDLDNSVINRDVKYDSDVKIKEQFVTAKSDGKINFYDRDGKLILSKLDNYIVVRSGNYFVASTNGEKYLYNIKGEKMFKIDNLRNDPYDMLNIYGEAYRIVTDKEEKVEIYYTDLSKKMNTDYMCFCDINGDLCIEQNGMYNLYDINKNILLENFKFLMRYDDKYMIYQKGFSYGLIDREGNIKFKFSIFDGVNDDE